MFEWDTEMSGGGRIEFAPLINDDESAAMAQRLGGHGQGQRGGAASLAAFEPFDERAPAESAAGQQ